VCFSLAKERDGETRVAQDGVQYPKVEKKKTSKKKMFRVYKNDQKTLNVTRHSFFSNRAANRIAGLHFFFLLEKRNTRKHNMSTEPQSNRLYVGNIPWSTTVEELQGLFTDAENIEIPTVRFIYYYFFLSRSFFSDFFCFSRRVRADSFFFLLLSSFFFFSLSRAATKRANIREERDEEEE